MSALNDLAARAPLEAVQAAEQLTALLALDDVGVAVKAATLFGTGGKASVEIHISDGAVLAFDSVREMTKPDALGAELVACTGAIPAKLGRREALKAVQLTRLIAERQATMTDNDVAADWGIQFLEVADHITLNMNDQVQRWGAFVALQRIDPWAAAREKISSPAAASKVLVHEDGTRFVRCGWFHSHVRTLEASVSQQQVAQRMARVGWTRRGDRGRIKATSPGPDGARLAWSFFVVEEGWERQFATGSSSAEEQRR